MGVHRIAHACLTLALAGVLAACAGSPPASPGPVDPTFDPAFAALRSAMDAGDEELAGRILQRILARRPSGGTLDHAEAYGRILRGRALARSLDLRLAVEELAPGRVRVLLVARHGEPGAVDLESGPATLRVLSTGIDARGVEERFATSHPVPALAAVTLPPGRDARVELLELDLPSGLALGVRTQLDLRVQGGVLLEDGEELPAAHIAVAGCEVQSLARWLPADPVEPTELARYVEAGPASLPALIERTVRIPPGRREEALDLLVPILLARSRPELAALVPSLRWLSSERDLGADTQAWWTWLEARRDRATAPPGPDSGLDLPTRGAAADGHLHCWIGDEVARRQARQAARASMDALRESGSSLELSPRQGGTPRLVSWIGSSRTDSASLRVPGKARRRRSPGRVSEMAQRGQEPASWRSPCTNFRSRTPGFADRASTESSHR